MHLLGGRGVEGTNALKVQTTLLELEKQRAYNLQACNRHAINVPTTASSFAAVTLNARA